MKRFWLKLKLAYQAYKNAERLKYRLIYDLDWDIDVPAGGSPSEFIEGLNKFLKTKVKAIDVDGTEVSSQKPFTQNVRNLGVHRVLM